MSVAYNDDVLTEILLRLPAKSLIRFKLVCKKLLYLISSPRFCHLHALRHRLSYLEPSLILFLKEKPAYFYLQPRLHNQSLVRYHFPSTLVDPIILSFSYGLVLLKCRDSDVNAPKGYYIYNPTTKQFKKLSLNVNDRCTTVIGLNLAYDPLKSATYKIICVRCGRRRPSLWQSRLKRYQIEVYESETNVWNFSGEPFMAPNDIDFNCGVYWNDAIHWSGIFFDLRENEVREHPRIPVLGTNTIDTIDGKYVESNGNLHYIAHIKGQDSVAVLELQSDYSKWCSKYHIDLSRGFEPISVLSLYKGEREEETMIVLHQPGKVVGYRLHDKSFKLLVDFKEEGFYKEGLIQFGSSTNFPFVECLAPLG